MTKQQFFKKVEEIRCFCRKYPYIFIYGAGTYAKSLMLLFHEADIPFDGCCITSGNDTACTSLGIEKPVYELNNIPRPIEQCGFVLSMNTSLQKEVMELLEARCLCNQYFAVADHFLRYYHHYALFVSSLIPYHQQKVIQQASLLSAGKELAKREQRPILLSRSNGLGDVLCLEPIARKLTQQVQCVFVETAWQELFCYNQSVSETFPWGAVPPPFEEYAISISCNDAYEVRPLGHMLDGYLDAVSKFIPIGNLSEEERIPVYDSSLIRPHSLHTIKNICINNEATNWESRIFDVGRMREFAYYLQRKGYDLYEIGGDEKNYLGVGKKCYGLALHDTVKLMSEMDLYIGMDNGLMHLAQSIRLPVFILFGCTCPNFRIYDWSRARVMWKNVDELPCAACYHRRMIPCREPQCHWETVRCLDWSVEEVIEAFENEKYDNPPKLLKEMYEPIWWNEMT